MAIKVVQRVKIEDGFIDVALKSYSLFLEKMSALKNAGDDFTPGKHAKAIARLLLIVRKKSPDIRSGFDYEATRFKGLEYTRLFAYKHGETEFIVGETPHVEIRDWKTKDVKAQLGKYRVFIPVDIFVTNNLYSIHLIPMRNPKSEKRHPHQGAEYQELTHPLERETRNCYGDYQPTMLGMLSFPDLPELMRQFHRHLRTYGDRPPYRLDMDFDIETGEEYVYPNRK